MAAEGGGEEDELTQPPRKHMHYVCVCVCVGWKDLGVDSGEPGLPRACLGSFYSFVSFADQRPSLRTMIQFSLNEKPCFYFLSCTLLKSRSWEIEDMDDFHPPVMCSCGRM